MHRPVEPLDPPTVPQVRLDELRSRLEDALSTRDRVHSLLEAVLSIGSDLELGTVLRRITEAAAHLVDAEYAGLGVVDGSGTFTEFIPVGVPAGEALRIPRFPHGEGVLGYPTRERRPLRIGDMRRHADFSGFPPGHPAMTSFLGVPIQVRDEVFGNLYLADKNGGGEFDADDEAVVTALATAAGVAIENARMYEDSRQRERYLTSSTEISTRLLSGEAAEDVLGYLVQQARQMAGADLAVLLLPDAADSELTAEIADGEGAQVFVGACMRMADSPCGQVYRLGKGGIVPDLRHADCPMLTGHEFRPGLLVLLGTPNQSRGVLVLGKIGAAAPFTDVTKRMLDAFAGQAAVALELAEARSDAERLVVLEDRDRIAKDLHDIVIQRLFASAMTLMSARRMVADPEAGERIQRTIDDLDVTIREIRSTVFALQHPPNAHAPSLRSRILASIEATTRTLQRRPGVRLDGPLDSDVPEEQGEQLLAVLHEALSNVARHAEADEVHVSVQADARLTLEVTDNGVGIADGGRSSGLRNMAERAAALGGGFRIGRRPDHGTELHWSVPLPTHRAPA
ncbi:signal transduction histidine kinase [Murinocardiopsis flavida]|uniref:Signal transduction histidine kinase n=1 Tax=Murinocardiopsis flavida TaxID=645275 RepID=A0A2P8CPJ7_9ACTN|nr:GAF domain-containing protein [Murinocardiopsis flavida]PSK86893.1 signal transduction histidine kinase [Murinocardiopsis flavida]